MRASLLSLLIAGAATTGIVAAPVPPGPKELTSELVVGTWAYEWGGWPSGIIAFNADGSYSAQHVPGSAMMYHGTYEVSGGSVTITEWAYNADFGGQSGPMVYRFEFAVKGYPHLVGTSNGSTKVVLSNPKR